MVAPRPADTRAETTHDGLHSLDKRSFRSGRNPCRCTATFGRQDVLDVRHSDPERPLHIDVGRRGSIVGSAPAVGCLRVWRFIGPA